MRRLIAICLLIVCVALPIIGLAATCAICGNTNATAVNDVTFTRYNQTSHQVFTANCTSCTACNTLNIVKVTYYNEGPHSLSHVTQWVTPTILYEYDRCSTCGYITNTKTTYHNPK